MPRMSDMAGEASTFCTMHLWDDEAFQYARVLDCVRHGDARVAYLALHAPPMLIVVSVRYGSEVLRP